MTTEEIPAIKTTWRGILFDSVLEADWAASLSEWQVDWVFHHEQIVLSDGRIWEPDFLLRNAGAFGEDIILEVKGAHNHRMGKVQLAQEANPDKVILVGRAHIFTSNYTEIPWAVWHRPDGFGYGPKGSEYDWDLNSQGEIYVSGEYVNEYKMGLGFRKAIANTNFIK